MNTGLHELFSRAFCTDCHLVRFSCGYFKVKFTLKQTFEFVQDCAKLLSTLGLAAYPQHAYDNHPYLLISELILEEKHIRNKLSALYHLAKLPLHLAATKGCTLILKKHLCAGENVMQQNVFFETALHIAARGKHLEIFMLLLEHGADINSKTINDETVLRIAISLQDSIILEKILAAPGIEINNRDHEDNTYLHLAAQVGNEAILNQLIKAGISIESNNQHGETPLISAIYANNSSSLRFLLEKGANFEHQDRKGATAIDIAFLQQNYSILKILIAKKSDINTQKEKNKILPAVVVNTFNKQGRPVENGNELSSDNENINSLKTANFFTGHFFSNRPLA